MSLPRIVSQDEWSDARLNSKILTKVKILLWRVPGTENLLKASSHEMLESKRASI